MDSLNHDNQSDVIEAFDSTSRYLDDLLNIVNPYFEVMVKQIYPPELQLNKANISQLIRFARVCNHVADFNARNKCLTAKLLQQAYRYHKLRNTFSKFYRRHYELISKFNVGLKTLLSEGLSEPEFYGDLVYKKKLIGTNDFSFQFRKIIMRYRRIGYNLNVMRQSACLVFNPLGEAVLTSTHNLCFGAKIRKKRYTPANPSFYIKVGFKGVFFSWTCFPDGFCFTKTCIKNAQIRYQAKSGGWL